MIDAILDLMEGLWTEFFSVLASTFTLIIILNDARPAALVVILLGLVCIFSMCISAFQWVTETHRNPTLFLIAFLTTVILSCISVFFVIHYVGDKTPFTGIITDKRWHYEWDTQEWKSYNTTCWSTNCQPYTAYDITSKYEDTGRRLKVGEICSPTYDSKGHEDGENCTPITVPIYDNHIYYSDNSWQVVLVQVTSGIKDEPYWPQLDLRRAFGTSVCPSETQSIGKFAPLLGCQRPGDQRSYYYYTFHIQNPIDLTRECDLPNFLDSYHAAKIERTIEGEFWSHQYIADCTGIVLK